MEKLMGPLELAELVGVPVATIYQWQYRGVGPRSLKVGRHLRFRPEDVEAWLQQQASQTPAAAASS